MYWENQPELPSDKGSNWSRGATRGIGSPPLMQAVIIFIQLLIFMKKSIHQITVCLEV